MTPTEIVHVPNAASQELARFMPIMPTQMAMERRRAIAEAISNVLVQSSKEVEGDYGVIPGTKKPTLLQPGAQKLDSLFGLVARFVVIREEEDWTGERHGGEPFFRYMISCQLWRGDTIMGEAIGECNSWEAKYRFRNSDRKCPSCGASAIIFTKRDNWWCAGFKGGCGKGFKKDDSAITGQETGKKPNPDIFDQVNTLVKMAQKRAHVAATINATSASEFFTQDLEDARPEPDAEPTTATAQPAKPVTRPAEPADVLDAPELKAILNRLYSCNNKQQTDAIFAEVCDALAAARGEEFMQQCWMESVKRHGDPEKKPGASDKVMRDLFSALTIKETIRA